MNKNSVLAVALAAVLAMSAASFAGTTSTAWADNDDDDKRDEKKEKRNNRLATFIKEIRNGDDNDDDERERNAAITTSYGNVKISAKGLAVEKKGNGPVETSDAALALTGSVYRITGNHNNNNNSHAKLFVNGTLDFGGDRYMVRAEGNLRLNDRLDFGNVGITGKIFKESERRDYHFHAKAIALPTQQADGTAWKLVGEQPAQAGRLAKIYALLGEIKLERAPVPAPAPNPSPDNNNNNNTGLDRFMISRIGGQVAGGEFTFAVTAVDGAGRVKTGYTGTVAISTNNGASPGGHASTIMPSTYTFTSADAGQHVFAAKMYNAKSDTMITVSGDGKTATSNAFAVAAAQAASVAVTPSSVALGSGAATTLSAQASDAYGNLITGATYSWSLGNLSIGTLVPSANTATFTAASPAATATGAVGVTARHGGATVSTSATVTVNPA